MSCMQYDITEYPEGYVYLVTPENAQRFHVRNRTNGGVFYIAKPNGSAPLKRQGAKWVDAEGEIVFPYVDWY